MATVIQQPLASHTHTHTHTQTQTARTHNMRCDSTITDANNLFRSPKTMDVILLIFFNREERRARSQTGRRWVFFRVIVPLQTARLLVRKIPDGSPDSDGHSCRETTVFRALKRRRDGQKDKGIWVGVPNDSPRFQKLRHEPPMAVWIPSLGEDEGGSMR